MGNDNIIIVVIVAVIAYFLLTSKTWISTVKAITDDPCSGYAFSPPLYAICSLFSREPAKAADGTPIQSPQTPAPTPTYPYVSTSPAGGIGRCKMYRDGQWWALSGCDADDYNCKEYRPATIADYFMRECKA